MTSGILAGDDNHFVQPRSEENQSFEKATTHRPPLFREKGLACFVLGFHSDMAIVPFTFALSIALSRQENAALIHLVYLGAFADGEIIDLKHAGMS